jgi:hypothetical protein
LKYQTEGAQEGLAFKQCQTEGVQEGLALTPKTGTGYKCKTFPPHPRKKKIIHFIDKITAIFKN